MGGKVGGGGGGWNWAAVDGAVITAARNKRDTHDGSFILKFLLSFYYTRHLFMIM